MKVKRLPLGLLGVVVLVSIACSSSPGPEQQVTEKAEVQNNKPVLSKDFRVTPHIRTVAKDSLDAL